MIRLQHASICVLLVSLAVLAQPTWAATCAVPSGAYPTIAAALSDPGCDPIGIAPGVYPTNLAISRDITLDGAGSASTTIAGWVAVGGSATDAVLNSLRIDASSVTAAPCHASGLDVRDGAKASGHDLVVSGGPTPSSDCAFLVDGFEGGDTAVWSARRS